MTTAVELIRSFRHLRALVIGDALLDTYYEGTAARLCSEGPVPVVRKLAEHHAPGGAANTAANLAALGAEVIFLSVVGPDDASLMLRSSLRASGIDDRFLITDTVATTPHKVRILADGQYVVRFDDEQPGMSIAVNPQLLDQITQHFATCDLVVISDYGYGVAADAVIARIRELTAAQPKLVFVDSKDLYRFRDIDATMLTPNLLEARLLVEQDRTVHPRTVGEQLVLAEVEVLGRRIHEKIQAQCVAITLAADGVLLVPRDGAAHHLPAHPVAQANDVGAGDSFLAGMALALTAGADRAIAAQIGLDAAAIAVTKRWTAVVPQRELLQRASLYDAATHDQMANSDLVLRQIIAAQRDGRIVVFTNGVFDILNAGHVRFLRQAKALGDLLVVGVNSNRSAQRLLNKQPLSNDERDRLALVAALEPVDHVVLFDEDTPAAIIRTLRPHLHVKGGDYADEALPEAEAVREVGARLVILPLATDTTDHHLASEFRRATETDGNASFTPANVVSLDQHAGDEIGAQG